MTDPLINNSYLVEPSAPPPPPYFNSRKYDRLYDLLKTKNYPDKLILYFIEQIEKVDMYIYILDESGSTASNDGKIYDVNTKTNRQCTRFHEMSDLASEAFEIFKESNIIVDFMSLNHGEISTIYNNLDIKLIIPKPDGGTPLCNILNKVLNKLNHTPNLGPVKLVIITDGESSDGDITPLIMEIQKFNVSITIRLTTDDKRVLSYWNNIDKNLEIRLDIIDSYCDEKLEVEEHNSKLNYTYHLHRIREFGIMDHRLDHADEMKLLDEDIRFFNDLTNHNHKISESMETIPNSKKKKEKKCIIM